MADRGWGRVINMSSVNGIKGQFGQANYSAAKAGILGFTRAIAAEVAKKGVTVNAVAVAAGWHNDDGGEFLDNYLRVTRRAKALVLKVFGG